MGDLVDIRPLDWPALIAAVPASRAILFRDASLEDVVSHVRSRCAYLATPYSRRVINDDLRWDAGMSAEVEDRTARWAWILGVAGVTAVSPILQACAMCHVDFEDYLDPLDDAFWSAWCQPLLAACGALIVPPMHGWDVSRGVWREVIWAIDYNVPVFLLRDERGGRS
jgi:hypothetical protein